MIVRSRLVILLMLPGLFGACAREGSRTTSPARHNSVVAFLGNAEVQFEDHEQGREIQRALGDMLNKSPEELRTMRYADYQGRTNAWSVTQLLPHYFVPDPVVSLDEENFFRDVRSEPARAVIQHQLDEVTRALK